MFGIGVPELAVILVIGLVIFGPGRLPDVGSALGRSMNEFRQAVNKSEKEEKETKRITAAKDRQGGACDDYGRGK